MNREFTILLKQPEIPPPSVGQKIWNAINDVVKSPLLVFIFGAGTVATIYSTVQNLFISEDKKQQQRIQEEARADAALIAPFLVNLSSTEEGKFKASRAALLALKEIFVNDEKYHRVFTAVNNAIDEAAKNIWYRPKGLDEQETKNTDKQSVLAKPLSLDNTSYEKSYEKLQNSLVYIQVEQGKQDKRSKADKIQEDLRKHGIIAPGIEQLESRKIPEKTQIRYFNEDDKGEAEDLAAIVHQLTNFEVYVVKPNLSAKKGTLEIWLGKNDI